MTKKLIFLDIETPNRRNASICQIGALLVDSNMNVLKEYEQLINPHEAFDPINIQIHGVTPSDVYGCPSFENFYTAELRSLLDGAVVINHNVSFDIKVLNKAICNCNLPLPAPIRAIDTLALARMLYTDIDDYKLDTLCEINGIPLNHHNALSDARAAFELYKMMRKHAGISSYEGFEYPWTNMGHTERVASMSLVPAMTELYGFLVGIRLNSSINDAEIGELKLWMQENARYASTPVFEDVFNLLRNVLADGVLTAAECERVMKFIGPFTSSESLSDTTQAENSLKGIIRGVVADKRVDFEEIVGLLEWRNRYPSLKLNRVYEELFDKLNENLSNNGLSSEANEELVRRCEYILNPAVGDVSKLASCSMDLNGAAVVLTGEFDRGSRNDISKSLEELGFVVGKGVTKKTDYVVIGNKGSEAYSNGNYGGKVKKAMAYGIPVVTEEDFFKLLEEPSASRCVD